jgi:hypothetical protein
VIIAALEQFFEHEEEVDSFRIGKECFGRFGSGGTAASSYADAARIFAQNEQAAMYGECAAEPAAGGIEPGNLSTDYKKLMRGKILAKYRSR